METAGAVWKGNKRHNIRVLLVDSSFVMRFEMGSVLERNRFDVVGETSFSDDVVSMAADLEPDVIVMDAVSSAIEGFSTLRALKRCLPERPVLLVGRWDDPEEGVAFLERALPVGVNGYLPRESPEPLIVSAVLALSCGGFVLSKRVAVRGLMGRVSGKALPSL